MLADLPTPPVATRRPTTLSAHGEDRVDEWYWLSDRDNPEVIAHLDAENAYTDAMTAATRSFREELFEEIRSHIVEADLSVPVRHGDWWYYSRTIAGAPYPIHCRQPTRGGDRTPPEVGDDGAAADEQRLLDLNREALGHDFFALANFEPSPDHALLAWSSDTSGAERFTVRFRDLATGADLPDVIDDVSYGAAWAADNSTFFYIRADEAVRPYQLWRHVLGTPQADDVLLHQEDDERFFMSVGASKDHQVLLLGLASKSTSEWRWLPADEPTATWRLIAARRAGVEYTPSHHRGRFLLVTNDGAPDFRLAQVRAGATDGEPWESLLPPAPDTRLISIEVFRDFVLLHERSSGELRIRILDLASGDVQKVSQPESPATVTPVPTPDFDSWLLRYTFSSFVTPLTVIDHDMRSGESFVRKRQPVTAYDPSQYETSRLWATAADGAEVPISIVHRADLDRSLPAACVLYGYGSYELSYPVAFAAPMLPLLDRSVVFAIAHVRGGGEMGRSWYDGGKMLNKRNTFTDYLACADHLIATGWTAPGRIVGRGASAGGLLMGAVLNERPEMFAGVVAGVPFVDVLTDMLDPSLPLVVTEREEWGDPIPDVEVYRYIRSYSPYDNVAAQHYPPILALSGLNDNRVPYWEPTKWVQRLRDRSTGPGPVLLQTEMGAGHGGPSDRYESWRREAFILAWVLSLPGVARRPTPPAR